MKPLKISHLSVGFVVLVGAIAVLLASYMIHELNGITAAVQARESLAADEEVHEALRGTGAAARRIAGELAQWEETRQQLAYDEYYALWRDNRVRDAGMIPETVDTVALYDREGRILRANPDFDPMPRQVPRPSAPAYLLLDGSPPDHGHTHLAYFQPVHADPASQILLGYVGIKIDLLAEFNRIRQFRFADVLEIRPVAAGPILRDPAQLAGGVRYRVRPNPSLDLVQDIFKKEMLHLLVFVIAILSVASFLLHRVMIRPLLAISREIDALHDASDNLSNRLGSASSLPVMELENVRRSFNNYQSRLAELHSNLVQSSRDFYEQARRDALSGTFNRRAFEEDWRNTDALNYCSRSALLLFDCDHFKAINDTYGHGAGDEVIKAIAHCLGQVLRSGDRLYRLGGDEFATVLPEADDERAKTVAERCIEQIHGHDFRQYGLSEPVSVSVGIAIQDCRKERLTLSEMQKRADLAMYTAKRPGNSKIVFYREDLGEVAALVVNRSVSGVYEAIQDATLIELHYQPIMSIPDGTREYAEALARVRFEDSLLSPADIFPIIQTRRLDAEFDLAVIRALRRDMESGRLDRDQGVSVNVSAPGIVHARVVEALLELRRAQSQRKIVVEITETALITQMEIATAHIARLREAGCLVALDDFGSGYSSLRYLTSMPVDLVKFDISIIRLLQDADPKQNLLTGEIAAMVKAAGYRIVAEGVESRELLDKVERIGFHYAQGYLLGRPA